MKPKIIERIQKKYKSKIYILPAVLTLGNAICGTFAIFSAFSLEFELAAYYIIFAITLDALDGRISRLTKSSSEFGIQLDSLSDAISFGLAPAIISWTFLEKNYSLTPNIQNTVALLYVCCTIIRLARFNIETDTSEESHLFFKGLPSPGAALFVTFNLLCLHKLLNENFHYPIITYIISSYKYTFPLIVCISAILMVSSIRYVHIFNMTIAGRKSKKRLIEILLLLLLTIMKPFICFWLISWVFVLYPLYSKYLKVDKKPLDSKTEPIEFLPT